jgi:hypothetical protein
MPRLECGRTPWEAAAEQERLLRWSLKLKQFNGLVNR